jgi:hypothetical protein
VTMADAFYYLRNDCLILQVGLSVSSLTSGTIQEMENTKDEFSQRALRMGIRR